MLQRQFTKNTTAIILNLVIQFTINFFLTSYLVRTVGSTAYGFFTLANTLVNYALIISAALNSMSARFVGIEYHNKQYDTAIGYYSSVFFGDIIFISVLTIPAAIFIWHINKYINVPPEILNDVRILFYIVFFNMCINVTTAVFSGVFIIKNRLDISSAISIISNIAKACLLIFLYASFNASIVYLGIATVIATLIVSSGNIYYNKKLLPELHLSFRSVRWKTVKTIIIAGIWNSFTQLSIVLLHGLDLLLCNILMSATAMGYLSIAGTLPGCISTVISSLSNLFTPKFLEQFASENYAALYCEIKNSMKFMTVISCLPICFLAGFGQAFYQLWVPDTDVSLIYLLSLCVIAPNLTGNVINSVNYLYTVVNKVKWPAIVLFINGVLNLCIVFLLLKFSNLGIYSIVIVSAVLGFIRNIIFNAPYAAHCIKYKFYVFWYDMLKSFIIQAFACCVCWGIYYFSRPASWSELFLIGGGSSIAMTVFTAYILLNREQRHYLLSKIHLIR